jgi:cytochrome c biogenesis protein ResB
MSTTSSFSQRSDRLARVYRALTRLDGAAVFLFGLLLMVAIGSFFPQRLPAGTADSVQTAQWESAIRERYGGLTGLLNTLGAFRWHATPGMLALWGVIALVTLVCTLNRWHLAWRQAWERPVIVPKNPLYTAQGTLSPQEDAPARIRASLERSGYRVRSERAGEVACLRGDRYSLSSLGTLVTHTAFLLLLLSALASAAGWREVLTPGAGETVSVGHGSGLALRYAGFALERYPDGSVADYVADIGVLAGGQEARTERVRVNAPLAFGPIRVYLQGYQGPEASRRITLLAVYDPGYPLFVPAGILLLLGVTVTIYLPHCRIWAQVRPDGTLALQGAAARQACCFEREFVALAQEFARAESPARP